MPLPALVIAPCRGLIPPPREPRLACREALTALSSNRLGRSRSTSVCGESGMGEADNAGVIVRPPVLYAAALVALLVLRWLWPLPILPRGGLWPGLVLVALGVGILIWGRRTLLAGGTNVDPSLPATAVVTSGPYRLSRNPLYVGLALVYFGLTLALDSWWGIVLLVAVLIVMHRGVIQREERYLEQKFGDGYRQYRSTVRRYI